MTSIYREKVSMNKSSFIQEVINIFGINHRNLQFLFTNTELYTFGYIFSIF